jgi:hypothetical protein
LFDSLNAGFWEKIQARGKMYEVRITMYDLRGKKYEKENVPDQPGL